MKHPMISDNPEPNQLQITVTTDHLKLTPHTNSNNGKMGFTCKMAGYDLDDVLNQMVEDYSLDYLTQRLKDLNQQ